MRRICVFCGSSPGAREVYAESARAFGRALAERGHELIYGGGSRGLMGILADAALASGARVIGVLPRGLFEREVPLRGLTELHEVASMHERKARMADLADAFVALPGGYGTYDELFEIITWAQIGLHNKPIALLDVDDYFSPLVSMVERAVAEGFVPGPFAALVRRTSDPHGLLDYLEHLPLTPPPVPSSALERPER
ncbi:MAG: TIGR00730 family Rossman fold protein [bacterium]|nr:TIGR00730 family Rossman fold protein [bacterium]